MFVHTPLIGFGAGGGYSPRYAGLFDGADFMTRTLTGDTKKWTFRTLVKRGSIGTTQTIFSSDTSGTVYTLLFFDASTNSLEFQDAGAPLTVQLRTTAAFTSTTRYIDVVVVWDTANGTAANRAEIWVDGVKQALSIATYPLLDQLSVWNAGVLAEIGYNTISGSGASYLDAQLADTAIIDGIVYDGTNFGPGIDPEDLSYGTAGSLLQYGDSGALGDDTSGNANDWTNTGVTRVAY